MAYIPCKIGGGTEKPTLLWTNPNTTKFDAQTISMDLSQYNSFLFELVTYNSENNVTVYQKMIVPKSQLLALTTRYTLNVGMAYYSSMTRPLSITDNGIEIGNGSYGSSSSASYNKWVVPLKIYGFKSNLFS